MKGANPEYENPSYVVDEKGSVPPVIDRAHDLQMAIAMMSQKARETMEISTSLRNVSVMLSGDEATPGAYAFGSEKAVCEELGKMAEHLRRMNIRIWACMRHLGSDVQKHLDGIRMEEDAKFSGDLEKFLESDPVGV
jgi:hypothetical protein